MHSDLHASLDPRKMQNDFIVLRTLTQTQNMQNFT